MKHLILALSIFWVGAVQAFIEQYCIEHTCTEGQQTVVDKWQKSGVPTFTADYVAFRGICYYQSQHDRPTDPQFALVAFKKVDEHYYFGGNFMFHAQEDPYAGLDLVAVQHQINHDLENPAARMDFRTEPSGNGTPTNFAVTNRSAEAGFPLYYIFRETPEGALVSYQQFGGQMAFCDYEHEIPTTIPE